MPWPHPSSASPITSEPGNSRPHVVIIGAGFGGLACAEELGSSEINVTLIDRRNYICLYRCFIR